MNHRYQPMLLHKADPLPQGPEWLYEAKYDGYRMLGYTALQTTQLISRHDNDFTNHFPSVVAQLPNALNGLDAVVDGEVVAFDQHGRQSLTALQKKGVEAFYYVFDLLELSGEPVVQLSLEHRRELLDSVITPQPNVKKSELFDDHDALLIAARQLEMEGIVAKRRTSRYRPGVRSKDWLKFKFNPHAHHNWSR